MTRRPAPLVPLLSAALRSPRVTFALALLWGTLALGGCGGEDRIPLSSIPPPVIRVLLGEEREQASIGIADSWDGLLGGQDSLRRPRQQSRDDDLVGRGRHRDPRRRRPARTCSASVPRGAFTLDAVGARTAYRGELVVRRKGRAPPVHQRARPRDLRRGRHRQRDRRRAVRLGLPRAGGRRAHLRLHAHPREPERGASTCTTASRARSTGASRSRRTP